MLQKKLLKILSKEGRTNCSPSGCLLYELFANEEQLDEMYLYLTKKQKSLDNAFSTCSEVFLQSCYKFDKKMAKKMFKKYVDNGNNFYNRSKNQMPCFLLKEMAKCMLQKIALLDIE